MSRRRSWRARRLFAPKVAHLDNPAVRGEARVDPAAEIEARSRLGNLGLCVAPFQEQPPGLCPEEGICEVEETRQRRKRPRAHHVRISSSSHFRRSLQCASRECPQVPWSRARPRRGTRISCGCFRRGACGNSACPIRRMAMTSPGKPAPEPRSSQSRASGARAQSCAESAKCRDHVAGRVERATRFLEFFHRARSSAYRVSLWIVSRGTLKTSAKSAGPSRLASRFPPGMARVAQAVLALTPFFRCARSSMRAAGVMPSSRAAWPRFSGRMPARACGEARPKGPGGPRRRNRKEWRCPRPCGRTRCRAPAASRRRRSAHRRRAVRRSPGRACRSRARSRRGGRHRRPGSSAVRMRFACGRRD